MFVHYRSIKVVKSDSYTTGGTWTKPRETVTTTTYDLASVQDHALEVPLGTPGAILGVFRESIGPFFLLWFLVFVILAVALVAIGGSRLLDKLFLPLMLATAPVLFVFLALPVGRHSYSKKQVEADVRRTRGTQDRYEIVSMKAWPKFAAKLRVPFP